VKLPRRLKLVGLCVGSLLLLALVLAVVGYLLAPHFYLTRVIFWGESDFIDLEKFPARTTRADTSTDPSQDYQYFWWVNTPEGEIHHFSARGKYGQYIYVAPEKDLVIVRLGKEEGERGYGYWMNLFEELATRLDVSAKNAR
jgi:hypothetical protein